MAKITFQQEKRRIQTYYRALDEAGLSDVESVLANFYSSDVLWRGCHPFHEIRGVGPLAQQFWIPLRRAITHMQRRQDIFFAGTNEMDGFSSTWVVSMGHLMGLFDRPWLGIAPTGKMAFLRYCEFHRIEGDSIVETAMFFDIPHLMMQAGLRPFPPQTAAHLVQPGPQPHNGLLADDAPEEEGRTTLALINAMIQDIGTWQSDLPLREELARTWHEDMIWWGPAGIGATYTIDRYADQHAGPFRAAFQDRSKTKHRCRLAEGSYGGFFGWPNFTARHTGGFMGMPQSSAHGEMRVIDIYRREGEKLAENWIFIDLLHFWNTLGLDVLKRHQMMEWSANE